MVILLGLLMVSLVLSYALVVVDMAKQDGAVTGCTGLFLFPVTYFWALFKYSGRQKKVVAAVLWGATALLVGFVIVETGSASRGLEGFVAASRSELGIRCRLVGKMSWTDIGKSVWVKCLPPEIEDVTFRSADEMVERYQEEFGSKLASIYSRSEGDDYLVLFIASPGDLVACYRIAPSGEITRAWYTGPSEPCDR